MKIVKKWCKSFVSLFAFAATVGLTATAGEDLVILEGGNVTYNGGDASYYGGGSYRAVTATVDMGDTVSAIKTDGYVTITDGSEGNPRIVGILSSGAVTATSIADGIDLKTSGNGYVAAFSQYSGAGTDLKGIGAIKVETKDTTTASALGIRMNKGTDKESSTLNIEADSLSVKSTGAGKAFQGTFGQRTSTIKIAGAVTADGDAKAYGLNMAAGGNVGAATLEFGSLTVTSKDGFSYGIHDAGSAVADVTLNGDMTATGKTYGYGFRLSGAAEYDFKGKDDKEVNITVSSSSNESRGADVGNSSSSTAKLNLDVNNFIVTSTNAAAYGLYAEASPGAAITGKIKNLSVSGGTYACAIYSGGATVSILNCTNLTAQGATASYAVYATNCTITLGKVSSPIAIAGDLKLFADTTLNFSNAVALAGNVSNAGTMTFDLTGETADKVTLIDYAGSETMDLAKYGTVELSNAEGYTLAVDGNDLVATKAAASNKWTDYAAASYATPIDTVNKVVTIASAAELALFAKGVNDRTDAYNNHTVNITADIDLSAHEWVSIKALDEDASPYWNALVNVVINGNHHTISGLTIDQAGAAEQGLIGVCAEKVTVKDLTIADADVTCGTRSGIVVGTCYGVVTVAGVTVTNSTLTGTYYDGALIGFTGGNGVESFVSNCVCAAVTVTDNYAGAYCGTMVGLVNDGDTIRLENNLIKSDCVCNELRGSFVGVSYNDDYAAVPAAAQIGDWYYPSLSTAIAAVEQNGTITILADSSESFTATPKDGVTAFTMSNAGGYALSGTVTTADGYAFTVNGDGTCTYGAAATYVAEVLEISGATTNVVGQYETLAAAFTACKSGETVVLLCDVDLNNEAWTPIELQGSFDGCNHTISNLYINLPEQSGVGFFTAVQNSSTIRHVTFVNVDVKGKAGVGALVGSGSDGQSTFEDITVTGSIKVEGVGLTTDGYAHVGTLVGGWAYGNYRNITVDGGDQATSYVKNESDGDCRYVGGIVGHADDVSVYENCTVKNITIKGNWLCGGIAGPGPAQAVCTGCTVESVTLGGTYSGALFGWFVDASQAVDDRGVVSNATIRNVTYLTTDHCGTVGGNGVDTNVVVRNITIENVPVLPYHYQAYTVYDGVTNHYGTILSAITSVTNMEDITVGNNQVEVPSGYELYEKDVLWGVRALANVVRVGTTEYPSIDAALTASSGDVEMVLIGDASCGRIELSGAVYSQIDSLTIDLNGYTMTDTGGDAFLTVNRLITIKDAVGTGHFIHTGSDDLVWLQGTTGGVVLESGSYSLVDGGYGLAYASHDATRTMLVIKGGTYNLCPTNDSKGVNYVPAGYEAVAQGTTPETWVVQAAAAANVARIIAADGSVTNDYEALQGAVDAAKAGWTITLLANTDDDVTGGSVPFVLEKGGFTYGGAITAASDFKTVASPIADDDSIRYMPASEESVLTADCKKIASGFYQSGSTYTASATFHITSLDGLKSFRDLVNNKRGALAAYQATGLASGFDYTIKIFLGKEIQLLSDLDLDEAEWEPIGNQYDFYTAAEISGKHYIYGAFDGCNHTVSHLKINNTSYKYAKADGAGLFGRVPSDASFKNLTLRDVNIYAHKYAGALCGNAGTADITISNVHVLGSISINGYSFVGGIIGHGCYRVSDCSVIANDGTGDAGAIIARNWQVGGIGGTSRAPTDYLVTNSTVRNIGIQVAYYQAGGIVGNANGNIIDCVADKVTISAYNESASFDAAQCGAIVGNIEKAAGILVLENTPKEAGQCGTTNAASIVGWDVVGTLTAGGVTGGTYEALPDEYVASGYEKVAQGTTPETWVVQAAAPKVAKIGDATYPTLKAAADAATGGQTIELIADYTVTADEVVSITDGVNFTAGDYTLTNEGTITVAGTAKFSAGTYTGDLIAGKVGEETTLTTDGIVAKYGYLNITDGSTVTFHGDGFDFMPNSDPDAGEYLMIKNSKEKKNTYAGDVLNHSGYTLNIEDADLFRVYAIYANAGCTLNVTNVKTLDTMYLNLYGGCVMNMIGTNNTTCAGASDNLNVDGTLYVESATAEGGYFSVWAAAAGKQGGTLVATNAVLKSLCMSVGYSTNDEESKMVNGDDPTARATLTNSTLWVTGYDGNPTSLRIGGSETAGVLTLVGSTVDWGLGGEDGLVSLLIGANGTLKMDAASAVTINHAVSNAGVIDIDMTGADESLEYTLIDANAESDYGTVTITDGWTTKVVDNDLIAVKAAATYVAELVSPAGATVREFLSIEDAFRGVYNNHTIRLIADCVLTNKVVRYGLSYTLDLNGKTIDGAGLYSFILGTGNVTIADTSDGQLGKIQNCAATAAEGGGAIHFANGGMLTLDGGTFTNNTAMSSGMHGGAIMVVDADFTMNGGSIVSNKAVHGGGVSQTRNSFVMNDGVIFGNVASSWGGGVSVCSGASMQMDGGRIDANQGYAGGGISVEATATLNITTNAVICENYGTNQGGGVYNAGGLVTMKGGTIDYNRAGGNHGGAIANTTAGGRVLIDGGDLSYNTTTGRGGAIMLNKVVDLVVSNATMIGNSATTSGGAIQSSGSGDTIMLGEGVVISNNTSLVGGGLAVWSSKATVTIDGVEFSCNTATQTSTSTAPGGGAIYVYNVKDLTIRNGAFLNNAAQNYGGGINIYQGTVTIEDGLFEGNNAVTKGGGAIYCNTGTLNISGGVFAVNRGSWGTGKGIWMATAASQKLIITGGTFLSDIMMDRATAASSITGGRFGANVRYKSYVDGTVLTGGVFTQASKNGSSAALIPLDKVFVSNDDPETAALGYIWKLDQAAAQVISSDGAKTNAYVTLQAAVDAVSTNGVVRVLADNAEALTVDKDFTFTIDANGNALSGTVDVTVNGYAFEIGDGTCTYKKAVARIEETGKLYETLSEAVEAASDTATNTVTMVAHHTLPASVSVGKPLILDLDGRTIDGNGEFGILVTTGGDLVINDASGDDTGAITHCTTPYTSGEAGAIEVSGGSLTLNGGTITGNNCEGSPSYGGGVFVSSGSFVMNGGVISDNQSVNGGGVYNASGSFVMNGGVICGNSANFGGGVGVANGTFVLNDGVISNNVALTKHGGGVHLGASNAEFTMNGGAIVDNTANYHGGGIGMELGKQLTITGGTISGNYAVKQGGGVFGGSYNLTITGGTITGNTSGGKGAAICTWADAENKAVVRIGETAETPLVVSGSVRVTDAGDGIDVLVTGGRFDTAFINDYTVGRFIAGGIFTDAAKPQAENIVAGHAAVANRDVLTTAEYPWTIGETSAITYLKGAYDGDIVLPTSPVEYWDNYAAWPLSKPAYTNDALAFAGWKFGDTELVTNVIAAGSTGDLTLTAQWVSAQKIEVALEKSAAETNLPIKVTQKWIDENVVEKQAEVPTKAEIQATLNKEDANGNLKWQNVVMGLDPSASVMADAKQDEDPETVPVVPNAVPPIEDTGYTVQYSLDRVADDGEVVVVGVATNKESLAINLGEVETDAYYKVNVIVQRDGEGGVESKFVATNTLGVLKVASAPKLAVIGVPWGKLGDGDADIAVEDLIKTANLTAGDKIHIYRSATKKYESWELDATGEWTEVVTAKASLDADPQIALAANARIATAKRGDALWVERQDNSKPLYLYGQVETNAVVTTEVTAGDEKWNLVASPRPEALDLNEKFGGAHAGDQIIVPTGGVPKNYTYEGGVWGYPSTEPVMEGDVQVGVRAIRKTDDTTIPAGTGFWYVNQGGEKKEIQW